MFYKPESIDDFYKDLHRIRAELTSIQICEKNWITSNLSTADCEEDIRALDEFHASLAEDDEHWEDYDSLCHEIELLQSEFHTLKEDIIVESLKDSGWENHLTYVDDLTLRILKNIPINFLDIYRVNSNVDITVDYLINEHNGRRFAGELLALYCFAKNGSKKALDYLNSVLQFEVKIP